MVSRRHGPSGMSRSGLCGCSCRFQVVPANCAEASVNRARVFSPSVSGRAAHEAVGTGGETEGSVAGAGSMGVWILLCNYLRLQGLVGSNHVYTTSIQLWSVAVRGQRVARWLR